MPIQTARIRASTYNPLDLIEQLVDARKWPFSRPNDDELGVEILGRWCDFHLCFTWHAGACAVHLTCAIDLRIEADRLGAIHELLAKVNERMWLGHFGLWGEEGPLTFRHALPLRGADGPSMEQLEDLTDVAVGECERFYPAFQFVVRGEKSPDEAVEAAILETLGEA